MAHGCVMHRFQALCRKCFTFFRSVPFSTLFVSKKHRGKKDEKFFGPRVLSSIDNVRFFAAAAAAIALAHQTVLFAVYLGRAFLPVLATKKNK